MLTDPIADMLTRIRNSIQRKHRFVDVNSSKLIKAILTVLKEEGFIQNFVENKDVRLTRVFLRYDQDKESLVAGLKRVSKPGKRIYVKWFQVPIVRRGLGTTVVSTSQGIMTGKKARQEKIGGELICCVW